MTFHFRKIPTADEAPPLALVEIARALGRQLAREDHQRELQQREAAISAEGLRELSGTAKLP